MIFNLLTPIGKTVCSPSNCRFEKYSVSSSQTYLRATAFNVSSADVNVRTILVDDLGQTAGQQDVVCILADKDIIQAYDTINTTTTFYNADKLATNYFAHKHGIMAGCSYANAIIFVKGDSIA